MGRVLWKETVTMVRFQCRLFTLTRSEPRVSPQRFQSGPFASGAFTTVPYTADTSYPSHPIRLLMLKRLHIPLPLSECTCRCRRNVDPLGDHRAACSRTRVLRTRGIPLEQTAARICRAARARVTTHTRVSDLNPPPQSNKLTTRDCPYTTAASWPLAQPWSPHSQVLANHAVEADNTQPLLIDCAGLRSGRQVERRGNTIPQTFGLHKRAQTPPRNSRSTAIIAHMARWSAVITHAAMHRRRRRSASGANSSHKRQRSSQRPGGLDLNPAEGSSSTSRSRRYRNGFEHPGPPV